MDVQFFFNLMGILIVHMQVYYHYYKMLNARLLSNKNLIVSNKTPDDHKCKG